MKVAGSTRETKRLQTRERLLGAAISEFAREGMARADIAAIVAAAGVAHGTFFFHFPTKEHVLLELERREEERMAAELARFFDTPHDVAATLAEAVRVLEALEDRLGTRLFKDLLALHFSTSRPPEEEFVGHPVIVAFVDELGRARDRGELPAGTDPFHGSVFFLLGLFALLVTIPEQKSVRRPTVDAYLATTLKGLLAD